MEIAETVGEVSVGLGADLARVLETSRAHGGEPPRFSTLLLTALAWHATGAEPQVAPLPSPRVSDFLRDVAARRSADPEAASRALGSLVEFATARLQLTPRQRELLQGFGRACLERLADDHARARRLFDACQAIDGLRPVPPDTNTLRIDVVREGLSAEQVSSLLAERGVWILALGPDWLRAVTHLDVSADDIDRALIEIGAVLS